MFFQDWLTPRNPKWLTDNTSLDERLNIVFLNDQTTFMTGYLNELGVGNINRALEHIPQMTTALYLNFVWEAVLQYAEPYLPSAAGEHTRCGQYRK